MKRSVPPFWLLWRDKLPPKPQAAWIGDDKAKRRVGKSGSRAMLADLADRRQPQKGLPVT